jgi:hypothetical protein
MTQNYDYKSKRDKLNEYWRDQREAQRLGKLIRKDASLFLQNPRLLQAVRNWINLGGVEYAKKCLSKDVQSPSDIATILKAVAKLQCRSNTPDPQLRH